MLRRVAPFLALYLFAPFTAEYLIGYDTSTGDPGQLLIGLLFFAPLYGGAAVIVRETARRTGRGWPTMILLALAFGLVQAGLVDHSLFNDSYRDIPYWEQERTPTYVPALGISAYMALEFLIGHVIWSIGVPIAMVETFVPDRRETPWLRKPGLATVAVLYLAVSALIFWDHVQTESFLPSTLQLVGAAAVVLALVAAAFLVGRRERPAGDRPPPTPRVVGAAALALLSAPYVMEGLLDWARPGTRFVTEWPGVALMAAEFIALAVLVGRWSRRRGWGAAHRLAVAGGALLSRAWLAFFVPPLGDVAFHRKLAHNLAFAAAAIVLLVMGARAARQGKPAGLA
jgi:hypothetical protein